MREEITIKVVKFDEMLVFHLNHITLEDANQGAINVNEEHYKQVIQQFFFVLN